MEVGPPYDPYKAFGEAAHKAYEQAIENFDEKAPWNYKAVLKLLGSRIETDTQATIHHLMRSIVVYGIWPVAIDANPQGAVVLLEDRSVLAIQEGRIYLLYPTTKGSA